MSSFVTLLSCDLSSRVSLLASSSASPPSTPNLAEKSNDTLSDYLLELDSSLQDAEAGAVAVDSLEREGAFDSIADADGEVLKNAILARVLIALYVQTLETFLNEASDAETELEWWSDIERSEWRSAYYLLQSECSL